MPPLEPTPKKSFSELESLRFFILGVIFILFVWGITAPSHFPKDSIITIEEGSGLYSVAQNLEEEGVVRSSFWFRTTAILLGGERRLKAGQYYFAERQNALRVAWRVVRGDTQIESIKVTIPEGFTVNKISNLFDEKFAFFDNALFEREAPEGYLFPDTYFIPVTATASSTIKLMKDNFVRKIFDLMPEIEKSKKSLEEIVTMASLLEGEANNQKDREIVSGILWKRLSIGMPLQVDTSFAYINGKSSAELTVDDLKIDSPFNTYLYKGLPPSPISNPGIESLVAALHPATSTHLYFLTGKDGKMYYSKTFEEHIANKQKYLR
jgi:UPF0755 protein